MRISDWSSDVCSSDLSPRGVRARGGLTPSSTLTPVLRHRGRRFATARWRRSRHPEAAMPAARLDTPPRYLRTPEAARFLGDRKSVVKGKSGSGRVDLGGSRKIKTKKKNTRDHN